MKRVMRVRHQMFFVHQIISKYNNPLVHLHIQKRAECITSPGVFQNIVTLRVPLASFLLPYRIVSSNMENFDAFHDRISSLHGRPFHHKHPNVS